jgi:hypothetical protein
MECLVRQVLWLSLSLLVGASCVTGPHYDQHLTSHTDAIDLEVWASSPGASIEAQCANHYSPWSTFATFTASTTAIVVHGDSVYHGVKNHVVVPLSCWDLGFSPVATFLHFTQTSGGHTYNMQTYDQAGLDCLFSRIWDEGAYTPGLDCALKGDTATQIRLLANY